MRNGSSTVVKQFLRETQIWLRRLNTQASAAKWRCVRPAGFSKRREATKSGTFCVAAFCFFQELRPRVLFFELRSRVSFFVNFVATFCFSRAALSRFGCSELRCRVLVVANFVVAFCFREVNSLSRQLQRRTFVLHNQRGVFGLHNYNITVSFCTTPAWRFRFAQLQHHVFVLHNCSVAFSFAQLSVAFSQRPVGVLHTKNTRKTHEKHTKNTRKTHEKHTKNTRKTHDITDYSVPCPFSSSP